MITDMIKGLLVLAVCVVMLAACGARSELLGARYEEAKDAGTDGAGGCDVDAPLPSVLTARVRDFSSAHPDFEAFIGSDKGIVEPVLGPDDKPVYAGLDGNPSTSGKTNFDQWFRDVPGVNLGADIELPLTLSPGEITFQQDAFFPIDGELLGNEGLEHNFHFTLESHASFRYQGGEVFMFEGDDDFWIFFNKRLALDLGGVHATEGGVVLLDELAPIVGLSPGEVYPLELFFAERHTSGSTLRLRLVGFALCP